MFEALIILLAADGLLLIALLLQQQQTNRLIKLMAKTAEQLAQEIRDANAQTRKATDEVLTRIRNLEGLLANGADLSAIESAVTELKASTQILDDIVPDAPAPEPEA